MSIKNIFFLFLLFLFVVSPAEGNQKILTVNYPPDKTVMEFGLLGVSLSVTPGSADLIKVKLNGSEQASIAPGKKVECFSVQLSLGVNKIEVSAIKDKNPVETITFEIFRRSDLERGYRNSPAGFQKKNFHMTDTLLCAECHVMKPSESDKKPVNPATFSSLKDSKTSPSTCYPCHKKMTAYPFVHGPASVWSCLSCHNSEATPVYFIKKPDTDICFACHIEQKEDWHAKKYIHGPVNTGNCAICHSPHASENPFNLVKPAWDLCVTCHVENATGRHIIAGFVYEGGHPTRGKPDPVREGKEMSCASCHNPHASNYPRLWALEAQSAFALCTKCHQK